MRKLYFQNNGNFYKDEEGSRINIEVSYFNESTKTHHFLYSYYGAEKRFIKH